MALQVKNNYRAVVVGCGKIGALLEADPLRIKPATHSGAFSRQPEIKLVGLVDKNPGQLKKAGRLFPKAPLFNNLRACLKKQKPDIVAVASSAPSHHSIIKTIIEYPLKAIVCEKPLADSLKKAEEIVEMVQKKQLIFLVNHQRRFDSYFQKAKRKIKEGALGKISQISAYYTNGLFNNGSHIIDTLRFLLNDEAEWVIGLLNQKNQTNPPNDLNIDGLIQFQKGALTTLQSLDNNKYGFFHLEIFGEKGGLTIKDYGLNFIWHQVKKSPLFSGYEYLDLEKGEKEGAKRSMLQPMTRHLLSCLTKKAKPLCTADDGLTDLKVLFALKQSAGAKSKLIWLK